MSNQQSSNPFGNLSNDGLEAARDVLGGGGVFESGVYDGTIALAYAGKSQGGAQFLAVHVQIGDKQYRETMYVTNKNGQNYWERDGKKNPLPGYTTANDICLMSTGYDLPSQDFQEKVVNLYDFDAKAEVPKKVMVAVDLIGKPITLAILKNLENKTKKNEATGQYEPIAETRETNTIDKVFHSETGKTASEFVAKKDPEFKDKWATKNTGRVIDKSKEVGGKPGAPGQARTGAPAASAKTKSLFG